MKFGTCLIPLTAAFVFLAVIFGISLALHRKRIRAMESVGSRLGLCFSAVEDSAFIENLGNFRLLTAGHSRKVRNRMAGEVEERNVAIFDYTFKPETQMGQSRVWQQTVMLIKAEVKELPSFSLRPKTVFDSLNGVRLDELNSDYKVQRNERDYILKAECEAVAESLARTCVIEQCRDQGGLSVEVTGNQTLIYKPHMLQKATDIPSFLQGGILIQDLIEEAVESPTHRSV